MALSSFPAFLKAATIETFQAANWSGGAYASDDTGEFSSCSIRPPSRSAVVWVVVIDRNFQWFLSLFNQQWTETPGHTFDLSLAVDGRDPVAAQGRAITPNHILVSLGFAPALVERFKDGHLLTIVGEGKSFAFGLDGSTPALNALLNCVRRHISKAERASSDKSPAGSGQTEANTRPAWARAEAATLLSQLAARSGIEGFRLVDMSDVPAQLNGYDAVWTAPNVIGALLVFPSEAGLTPAEAAVALLASGTRECRGKFESNFLRSDQQSGPQAVRLATTCADSQSRLVTYYTILPRPTGGLYVFTVIGSAEQEESAARADVGIRVAARQILEETSGEPQTAAGPPSAGEQSAKAERPSASAPEPAERLPPSGPAPSQTGGNVPPATTTAVTNAPTPALTPPGNAQAQAEPSQPSKPLQSSQDVTATSGAPEATVQSVSKSAAASAATEKTEKENVTASVSDVTSAALLKRGDELLALGDLSGARLCYERAAAEGNPKAATAAGKTYDPIYFQETGVRGAHPDADKALGWYRKAMALGDPEAQARLKKLEAFAKQ